MRLSPIAALVTLLLATGAAAASWSWLKSGPGRDIETRGPAPEIEIEVFKPKLPGVLTTGEGQAAESLAGSWPCFRGPYRDGISWEEVKLAESWPATGPKQLWSIAVGEGYAGVAVHRGRVYLTDYDEGRVDGAIDKKRRGDALRCLSLADGKEIWRRWYHLPMVRYHGITRTVPAVTDRHVVSFGPMAHVLCVDAVTGEARWWLDLVEEFGAVIPEWYAAQCPRIDVIDDKEIAILAPGGDKDVLMIAIDCASGEKIWRTPNPRGLQMTHSSIAHMEWQGKSTYVYCTTGGVVGVAAQDGRLLWEYPGWTISPAIVPTPVILDGNRIFLTGGYKAGSLILEIGEDEDGAPVPAVLARLDCRTFGSEQHTPIFFEDCIYSVLTRNAGPNREQLVCLSHEGAPLWTSGAKRLFELGPFVVADGKLLLMNDAGVLTMVRPAANGYEELARAQIFDGHEAWGPMAVAGGRLLARDLKRLVCLDLRNPSAK
jgi:outer membrane protein assembly factor BamB